MKSRKTNDRDQQNKMSKQIGGANRQSTLKIVKEKYKHKSHWLEDEDDNEFPNYKEEEE